MIYLNLETGKWRLKGWMPHEHEWDQSIVLDGNQIMTGETDWIDINGPGSVYSALMAAGIIPDPYYELNSRACEWVAQRDWLFECRFRLDAGHKVYGVHELLIDGIDHHGCIFLNGHKLGEQEGLYNPAVYGISSLVRLDDENILQIVVSAAPDGMPQIGYTEKVWHLKPRFTYKWDFAARLVELGIRRDISVRSHDGRVIEDIWVKQNLDWSDADVCRQAALDVTAICAGDPARLELSLADGGSEIAAAALDLQPEGARCTAKARLIVDAPRLWWPNGMGLQHLYRLRARILDTGGGLSDQRDLPIGLRQIDFTGAGGAFTGSLPYFCLVNKKPLSIKGWNFVPVEQRYCDNHEARYARLLQLARDAHVNLLRVWGGGLIESEYFYDLCDRYGLLIWQEFPQSSSGISNQPSHEPAFLARLKAAARAQVVLKRNHSSLAIWCGGNELTGPENRPLDEKDPNLALLGRIVRESDPERLFLPTSPSGPCFSVVEESLGLGRHHDTHGPWKYLGNPEHYRFYNLNDSILHSEFGVDGMASPHAIAKFTAPEHQWPLKRWDPGYHHHGGAWWDHAPRTRALFGEISNLRDAVYASQFIQAEGLRYAVEANRRRQSACAGSIIWQLNEPFPNTTCTSAVDYYLRPKMAYYWVARSYRRVHVSLRYDRLHWRAGEDFCGECYVHNDTERTLEGEISCDWHDINGMRLGGSRFTVRVGPYSTSAGLTAALRLPSVPLGLFFVTLHFRAEGTEADNRYFFSTAADAPFAGMLRLPRAELRAIQLDASERGPVVKIENRGESIALFTRIETEEPYETRSVSDNFLSLLPGEGVTLKIDNGLARGGKAAEPLPGLTLEAWNVSPESILQCGG